MTGLKQILLPSYCQTQIIFDLQSFSKSNFGGKIGLFLSLENGCFLSYGYCHPGKAFNNDFITFRSHV